ncbi:hypothetical protein ACJX0J_019221, partial [Zea mays]
SASVELSIMQIEIVAENIFELILFHIMQYLVPIFFKIIIFQSRQKVSRDRLNHHYLAVWLITSITIAFNMILRACLYPNMHDVSVPRATITRAEQHYYIGAILP